ncbi:mRNA export protein mlo3 [Mycena venus]|uniref:mRNA export protein mlo3 n=1 Tax=Mycena venus TaxID=2733690 RepID=A0A8H6YLC1_9AGAR|nr:mRNA export protein mlo3 [Mycena venus]
MHPDGSAAASKKRKRSDSPEDTIVERERISSIIRRAITQLTAIPEVPAASFYPLLSTLTDAYGSALSHEARESQPPAQQLAEDWNWELSAEQIGRLSEQELMIWKDLLPCRHNLRGLGIKLHPFNWKMPVLDLRQWQAHIPGREGTPWEGGVYSLDVIFELGSERIPRLRFVRPLFHPNVYPSGTWGYIGHPEMKVGDHHEVWAKTKKEDPERFANLLRSIQKVIHEPDLYSPAQSDAYTAAKNDPKEYEERLFAMQAQYRPPPHARLNAFHGQKRQLLGNPAGYIPPAWRNAGPSTGPHAATNGQARGRQVSTEPGSKIFLSRLPMDVGETEVEELFKKTVGPLRESFLIYNSQGKSKGMAVVVFQRPGDAAIARQKYDGKIVDGRRPLKIEVIVETAASVPSIPSAPPAPPTLFDRLQTKGPVPGPSQAAPVVGGPAPVSLRFATQTQPHRLPGQHTQPPRPATPYNSNFPAPIPPRRYRTKKGPKRLKKQWVARSKEQLDRDMEDYRASAQANDATV